MTDIIVIGGGIAGLSAAARLSHLGKVTLIERERSLGYHASGRSAALFEENYGKPSVVALNAASRDYHMTANGGVLSDRGFMLLGRADEQDAFDADCAKMGLDRLTVGDAKAMVPILNDDVVTQVAWHKDAWDIDTDRLMQNFAREVTQNGGAILGNAEVTQINRTRQGWEVRTTTQGVLGCKLLVNAAGAWVDQIALMARINPLGVTPLRRSMGRIPAPNDHDVSSWPMIFGPGETWYAKPDAGALIVSPAEEAPSEPMDAYADDMTLAEGMARYEEYVTTPVTRMLANWAGLRTFAPDRELVLGPDPVDPAFIWCAGQGGYGFQSSPAASQLLADVVAGRTPEVGAELAARLSPARFS